MTDWDDKRRDKLAARRLPASWMTPPPWQPLRGPVGPVPTLDEMADACSDENMEKFAQMLFEQKKRRRLERLLRRSFAALPLADVSDEELEKLGQHLEQLRAMHGGIPKH